MNAPDRSPKRCRNLLHPRGRLYMKLSMKAFCMGLPGAMSCHSTWLWSAHTRMALLVSSVPLSLTTVLGLPRSITSRSSSRAITGAGERGIGHQRQALAGAIIDNGEDTEPAAVGELIRHEVERPAVVRRHRHRHRRRGPDRPLAAATAAHREPLFPVQPEEV